MSDYIESHPGTETIANLVQQMMSDEQDEKSIKEFLKIDFLTAAVDALFHTRKQAGLTQAQVAEIIGTKQSAIARLENGTFGTMSLQRYVDYMLACGMIPFEITMVSVNSLRSYIQENPESPKTETFYNRWLEKKQPIVTDGYVIQKATTASSNYNLTEANKPTSLPSIDPGTNTIQYPFLGYSSDTMRSSIQSKESFNGSEQRVAA